MKSECLIRLALFFAFFLPKPALSQTPVDVHAQLDVVGRNTEAKDFLNTTPYGASNFHALRVRLFLEKKLSDHTEILTQFLADNSQAPGIYAAFLRVKTGNTWLNFQVGRIPNPFGIWGPVTTSDKNPLISTPLAYNYQTALVFEELQTSPAELLAHRGQGPLGDDAEDKGLPFVSDAAWNTGLSFFGGSSRWDYTLGLLTGSLSYALTEREKTCPQLSGRLAYSPTLGLTAGLSFAYGPYLEKARQAQLPPGADVNKFYQRVIGGDLKFERGEFEGRAELIFNRWNHPFVPEQLDAHSFYLQAAYKFAAQFFAAARYERMEFSKIADSPGGRSPWDFPLYRTEAGLGYKLDRNVTIKIVGQLTRYPGRPQLNHTLWATQFSANF